MTDAPPITWLDRACVIIPALDAEATLGAVVDGLRAALPLGPDAIYVVDDGSRDGTDRVAREKGCILVTNPTNRGKGAALRAGFEAALDRGMRVGLTVDADGQHPADAAARVLLASATDAAFVLGVRDLVRAGAPRANRFSNGISNHFISRFAQRPLLDTNCGLRRYPLAETLALRPRGRGFDFEAEVILRAVWAGHEVVEQPIDVLYPPDRRTHFRVSRDPWLIVHRVVATVGERWLRPRPLAKEA